MLVVHEHENDQNTSLPARIDNKIIGIVTENDC